MTALGRTSDTGVGFGYSIDSRTARRQLNFSIGVLVILAIAIATAALSLDVRPVSGPSYFVSIPSVTQQADRAVSAVRG
jgi:hypothetical protein